MVQNSRRRRKGEEQFKNLGRKITIFFPKYNFVELKKKRTILWEHYAIANKGSTKKATTGPL